MPNTDGSVKLLRASLTSKEHRETQLACMLYCLRDCLGFSETECHSLAQKPWTQTSKTCLSRQLDQANYRIIFNAGSRCHYNR